LVDRYCICHLMACGSLVVSHGHGEVMRRINRGECQPSPFSFLLVQTVGVDVLYLGRNEVFGVAQRQRDRLLCIIVQNFITEASQFLQAICRLRVRVPPSKLLAAIPAKEDRTQYCRQHINRLIDSHCRNFCLPIPILTTDIMSQQNRFDAYNTKNKLSTLFERKF
jgi:hypothetical protein